MYNTCINFISKFIEELQNTLYTMTDHNSDLKQTISR